MVIIMKINPLIKRHWRLFKNKWGIYLSIFMMMFSIVVMMSGYFVTANNIRQSTIQSQIDNKAEVAGFIIDKKLNSNLIKKINNIGFEVNENFYFDYRLNNDHILRIFKKRFDINQEVLLSGDFPVQNEIAIDRLFAKHNDIILDQSLQVDGINLKVSGLVALVDYGCLMRKTNDFMMDSYNFGVAIVNEQVFNNFNDDVVYNYSLFRNNDEQFTDKEKYDDSVKIKKLLLSNGYNLSEYNLKDNNKRLSFIVKDMQNVMVMMQALMGVVFVIIAFVFRVLMKNIFDKESVMIGTLKASGYSNFQLIRHYCTLPIMMSLLASLFGNIVGYTLFPSYYKNLYYSSYSIPPMKTYFNLEALILTTIIPLVIISFMTILTAIIALNKTPLKLLRKENIIKNKLQPFKKSSFKFIKRFYIRVIFQNITAYLVLVLGLIFANLMLLFGISLSDNLNHYIDNLSKNMLYPYQYMLKSPLINLDREAKTATVTEYVTDMPFTNHELPIIIYGLDKETDYNGIKVSDDGVAISQGLADKMFLRVGSKFKVKNKLMDENYEYDVVDINKKEAQFIIYINKDIINKNFKLADTYYNYIFSNKELKIDEKNLMYSIYPVDIINQGKQFNNSFQKTNIITLTLSTLLYFVIVYNIAKSIIDHNSQSIAYLKIFGYTNAEISKLYLRMTLLVVVFGGILACPVSFIIYDKFLIVALYKMNIFLHGYVPWWHFVVIVMSGFILYLLIQSYLVLRIKQIKMSDALKQLD